MTSKAMDEFAATLTAYLNRMVFSGSNYKFAPRENSNLRV